jgi:hypothetical protein
VETDEGKQQNYRQQQPVSPILRSVKLHSFLHHPQSLAHAAVALKKPQQPGPSFPITKHPQPLPLSSRALLCFSAWSTVVVNSQYAILLQAYLVISPFSKSF